jgi:Mrp family chromosome partitioning ATPase
MIMPSVDACVLVVAEGETTEDEITRSLQLLGETKYLGTILNKAEDNQTGGYYY